MGLLKTKRENVLLTILEAHDLLVLNYSISISLDTLKVWSKKYKLGRKIGCHLMVDKQSLVDFMNNKYGEKYDTQEDPKKTFARSSIRHREKTRKIKIPKGN